MNDRRHRAFHWAVIFATPWLLLAVNPNLFVTPYTNKWIDPWLYTGFFLSLPEHFARWGDTYYATRLSWLLPGFALHRLFSPVVANYVLHIGFFYVLLFATYFLVTSGINRTTAFVVTLLVAWNPEVLGAIGWDYVDGAVITYFAVSLLCLEKASADGSRTWLWGVAAGAGLACMATANLVATTLWPICGLFLLLRVGASRWRRVFAILGVAAIGASAMFAAFGLANQQLGGRFLFLQPSVVFAGTRMWLPSPWDVEGMAWLPDSPALILPAIATLGAVLALAGRAPVARSFSGSLQVTFLVATVWWVIHSALWTHSIHIFYYTSYLVPLALVTLAVHPYSPLKIIPGLRTGHALALELATLAVLVVHLLFLRHGDAWAWKSVGSTLNAAMSTRYGINAYVGCAVAGVALISLRLVRARWFQWPAFLLALLMAYSSVPENFAIWSLPRVKDDLALTASVHEYIRRHLDPNRSFRMWYRIVKGEPRPYRNISSSYLWGYVLVNEAMPLLEPNPPTPLDANAQLVLMAANQREVETARAALRKVGFVYSPQVQQEFGPPDIRFQVIIGGLSPVAASGE